MPTQQIARLDRKPPRLRGVVALFTIGALALSVAACGGSSTPKATASKSTSSTGSTGSSSAKASTSAFTACLKQHGVSLNFPRGGFRPGSGSPRSGGGAPPFRRGGTGPSGFAGGVNSKFAKAFAACASLRPRGSFFGGGSGAFNSTAFTAYRNCLKLHGISLPTGPRAGATGATGTSGAFNSSNPKVRAALSACAPLRPRFGGATGPSGSTGPSSSS